MAIHPDAFYTVASFLKIAHISRETITLARRRGIEFKTIKAGKVTYVYGADGISFLQAIAARQAAALATQEVE